ncbi:hypothetical protein [Metabacillus sp. SLBN-84]
MKPLKNIEETGLLKQNENKISLSEFLKRHEPDVAEVMQELEREEEYGE